MKIASIKRYTLVFLLALSQMLIAQKNKTSVKNYPNTFNIENKELDALFKTKLNQTFRSTQNMYLNGAVVLLNSSYKENKQLKLKLKYFKNAELFIQINGKDSKIIYILSSDDSIYYNSKIEQDKVIMTQCKKDDILSE